MLLNGLLSGLNERLFIILRFTDRNMKELKRFFESGEFLFHTEMVLLGWIQNQNQNQN